MKEKTGGFFKELLIGKRYHLVRYVAGYALLWLILCLVLTNKYGKRWYDEELHFEGNQTMMKYEEALATFRETARVHDMTDASRKVYIEYEMQRLAALSTTLTGGEVSTCVVFYNNGMHTETHEDRNAYLVVFGDNGRRSNLFPVENGTFLNNHDGSDKDTRIKENVDVIRRCNADYLKNLWDETLGVKKSKDTAWVSASSRTGWIFEVLDGYLSESEFQPGKVRATYYENGKAVEEKVIACTYRGNGKSYGYVEKMPENRLYFPKDTDNWKTESWDAFIGKMQEVSNQPRGVIYPMFYTPRFSREDYEVPVAYNMSLVRKMFVLFGYFIDRPFSYFSGDVASKYHEIITDAAGNESEVLVFAYLTGKLANQKGEVLASLRIYYIVLALLIALIAFIRYRRVYSLRAKNQFHKSLINSMAHDLKTPLMIMQGFSENLAENVHEEKREYYAAQIQENIARLNGLIDKNLDLAVRGENEISNIGFFVMDLVNDSEKRLGELLEQKKLTLKKIGDTRMHGDPELMQTVVDNLIGNAVKYAPEGDTITVYGDTYTFRVTNRASLTYGKNINQLLEPLEMGEESRTSGQGTGLGLSIANGIVREHGFRMKLSYDRKNHEFTCMIRIPRWKK